MSNNKHPVIIVAAYNRPASIQRVLSSLSRAFYPHAARLIISIDNNGTNQDVFKIARDFEWKHGEKEVIYHPERLGLRKHIITCGNRALEYGSAIILEDDLYVSPYFYEYALKALAFYGEDKKISGISLYNLTYAESNKLPFTPLEDDTDVYFIQMAASLGQIWTANHWRGFMKWYDTAPELDSIEGLPRIIKNWPASSWKKYFIGYLIVSDTYFVFPRKSFTTNFNDPGENMVSRSSYVQVPLQISLREPKFKKIEDSNNVYDAYSELKPECLNKLNGVLNNYDYELDLYGKKVTYSKPYVVTSRPVKKSILEFERSMKPHEMNIIMDIRGKGLSMAKSEDIIINQPTLNAFLDEYAYFYTPVLVTKMLIRILIFRLKKKIKVFFRHFDENKG